MLPQIDFLQHSNTNRFFLMAGPCAAESEEIVMHIVTEAAAFNVAPCLEKSMCKNSAPDIHKTAKDGKSWCRLG